MNKNWTNKQPTHLASLAFAAGLAVLVFAVMLSLVSGVVLAAPPTGTAPGLGAAATYSVMGKAGVTNTGPSSLSGNVGADSSITGFPPGSSAGKFLAPAVNGPEADAATAGLALTSQASGAASAGPNLTGVTLVPGVYSVGSALLPGALTLNGPGVYIFLASSLTSSGSVNLTNGASACNVFWHVTSSASITGGSFVGTIIAGTSITFGNAVRLDGRALALTGSVTLINDTISGPSCAASSIATATSQTGATATRAATSAAPVAATATATLAPSATSALNATATAAAILPVTGGDLVSGQAMVVRMAFLGLGLVLILLGFAWTRKLVK
jgi:hypothetical protein